MQVSGCAGVRVSGCAGVRVCRGDKGDDEDDADEAGDGDKEVEVITYPSSPSPLHTCPHAHLLNLLGRALLLLRSLFLHLSNCRLNSGGSEEFLRILNQAIAPKIFL